MYLIAYDTLDQLTERDFKNSYFVYVSAPKPIDSLNSSSSENDLFTELVKRHTELYRNDRNVKRRSLSEN